MNRFIIADAQKCIGCRTCEVACVVSHQQGQDCSTVSARRFTPRIRVVKSDELSTATHGVSINGCALVVKAVWWRALMGR